MGFEFEVRVCVGTWKDTITFDVIIETMQVCF